MPRFLWFPIIIARRKNMAEEAEVDGEVLIIPGAFPGDYQQICLFS